MEFHNDLSFINEEVKEVSGLDVIDINLRELQSVSHHTYNADIDILFSSDIPVVECVQMAVYNFARKNEDGTLKGEYILTVSEVVIEHVEEDEEEEIRAVMGFHQLTYRDMENEDIFVEIDINHPAKMDFITQILQNAEEEVIGIGETDPTQIGEFRVNTELVTTE